VFTELFFVHETSLTKVSRRDLYLRSRPL
jgi:hypothetical protein